jgi:predicted RNA-binding protein with PUA-like domain
MRHWLLKSEPDDYSYADLVRDGVAEWDGVTANPAQAQMRQIAPDDLCVVYHTGDERQAIGLARVVRGPYPDPTDQAGKRVWVDLTATEQLSRPVPLSELRAEPTFADSPLLRMSRLSVVPLTPDQYDAVLRLSRQASA